MNSLAELLKDFRPEEHKPSLPAVRATPKPERNKVTGNPVRIPVNRQSALLLSPMRSWISQPLPPEKLPSPDQKVIDKLKADLKAEWNSHASTRDALGSAREELRKARTAIERLADRNRELEEQLKRKDDTIRQLEDIKL